MTAIPAGFVATAALNCFTIVSGSQFDQTYRTLAPRSAAACFAPLKTLTAKTPPAGPPGKNTIFWPAHHLPAVASEAADGAALALPFPPPTNAAAMTAATAAAVGTARMRT